MRRRTYLLGALLLVLICWLCASVPVDAQEVATINPSSIALSVTQGTIEKRSLLIETTSDIHDIRVTPLDLVRVADGATLSSGRITVDLDKSTAVTHGALVVPVTFDLQDAPRGEFRGDLLILHSTGRMSVPITIRIKDSWQWPLFVLMIGVGAGFVISFYRDRGRPRDEVLVRAGQLRAQIRSASGEEEFSTRPGYRDAVATFRSRAAAALIDSEYALQSENWNVARMAVVQAETIWLRWRKWRDDWITQINYCVELRERLKCDERNNGSRCQQSMCQQLRDLIRDAPDMENPQELRRHIDTLRQQLERYQELETQLCHVKQLYDHMYDDHKTQEWDHRIRMLEQQLHVMSLEDTQVHKQVADDLRTVMQALEHHVAQQPDLQPVASGYTPRGIPIEMPEMLPPPPTTHAPIIYAETTDATARLQFFTWFSYLVIWILLITAGFTELYENNPLFGASPWSDYPALLAWGFGSEASRAAVVEMWRNLGLPTRRV